MVSTHPTGKWWGWMLPCLALLVLCVSRGMAYEPSPLGGLSPAAAAKSSAPISELISELKQLGQNAPAPTPSDALPHPAGLTPGAAGVGLRSTASVGGAQALEVVKEQQETSTAVTHAESLAGSPLQQKDISRQALPNPKANAAKVDNGAHLIPPLTAASASTNAREAPTTTSHHRKEFGAMLGAGMGALQKAQSGDLMGAVGDAASLAKGLMGGGGGGGHIGFIGKDVRTAGNWINYYGSLGGLLLSYDSNEHVPLPKGSVSISGDYQKITWQKSTKENQALLGLEGGSERSRVKAGIWGEEPTTLTFHYGASAPIERIAFYFVDELGGKIVDLYGYQDEEPKAPDVTIMEFGPGVWVVYQIDSSKPFYLKLVPRGTRYWVLSGVFLDKADPRY